MKILHTVQRYLPEIGGSEEVVKQVSEHLVARGHEVTVATRSTPDRRSNVMNGVRIEEFDCAGNLVEGVSGEKERYREFLRSGNFDLMMNYAAQIWTTDLVFDLLPTLKMKKVLSPCGYSNLTNPRYTAYYERMPSVLRLYDGIVYHSGNYQDKHFSDTHGITHGIVIPNGADLLEFGSAGKGKFRERHGLPHQRIVLNVSNHSALKGHRFFWNCASALDRARFVPVLIGNAYFASPKKWLKECYAGCRFHGVANDGLVLENYPRHQVVEAFTDADIFLFGSQVECSPLVMFEAFASKTLFISTDCGNVRDYSDIICIVQDEQEAIGIVNDFALNPETYRGRIEKAYDYFNTQLNWEAIASRYESLYTALAG